MSLPGCAPGSPSRPPSEPAPQATALASRRGRAEKIADHIARDNPVRAASFVAELEAKCRVVAETPELYPARLDLAPGLRMRVHRRYLVLYRDLPGENTVRIERVLHSARNLPRLL
jgi:toxin ParE1/3/4